MTIEGVPWSNRRLSCAVSRAVGEDPAGTAAPFAGYLMAEIAPPWKGDVAEGFPEELRNALARARAAGVVDKMTGLVPDREYSREGHARAIFLRRPARPSFAFYEKEEYIVPESELAPLVEVLATRPEELPRFAGYKEDTSLVRDLLVCTHGSRDVCCGRFGYPVYEELRRAYAAASGGTLRVWRTSHTGGHRFAPNVLDLPEGRYWCRVERPEDLRNLVLRDAPAADLAPLYRGWAGLGTRFEQVAEREVLAREGWKWVGYEKAGEVLETSDTGERTRVRLGYRRSDGTTGAYEATVEARGTVKTLPSSGTGPLEEVGQYAVSGLERVSAPDGSQPGPSVHVGRDRGRDRGPR